MKTMKSGILTLILLLSTQAMAGTALEWQKVNLEEKIGTKVKRALSKVLADNQYLVESEVKFNDPGPPNFDDLTKVGLKVSDVRFDDSKGDYIAFSKVGLEVPVIEKYYQDHQQQLKELHRFNESYNLFKNIESINIKVYLSDLLSDAKVTQAKAVVNNLQFAVAEAKPKITYEKMSLEIKKKIQPKPDKLGLKDILDFLSQFGNAFGLIVATILFGLVMRKLLRLWEEIMQNLSQKPEDQQEEEKEEEEEGEEGEDGEGLMGDELMFEDFGSEDFERFKKFMEKSKQDATMMLKRWISVYDEEYQLALKAVAQQLKDDELMEMFSGLNDTEREKWKNALDEFLDTEQIKKANKFVSEEVVRSMIGPSQVDDIELIDMLLSLEDEVAKKFVQEKSDEGKVLMNLLTPQFSGKILDQLDEDEAQSVITNSLDFDFADVTDNFAAFKGSLKEFMDSMKRKPFNDKIVQMLPDFNPLKESMLYEFLANEGMRKEMNVMAKENFPSDLIPRLPGAFLKKNLQEYDKDQRVLLLASCDEEVRDVLMSAFAEEGSAAREMLDLEFEEIENNQIAQAKIANQKDDLWKAFVIHTRTQVKGDEEFKTDIDLIITGWVDELCGEGSGEKTQAA
jgi:hypothetical protein